MTFFQSFKRISPGEWRFVWLIAILVILATTLPYLYGYLVSPGYFLGSNYTNFGDVTVYLSLMNQAEAGRFLFENLFTSEFSYSFSFRPLFLILGLIVKITHLPNILIFQLARIVFGFLLLLFLYFFIAYFLADKFTRQICFLLLAFGAGVGALVSPPYHQLVTYLSYWELFQTTPADLFLPEANIFVNIFHSPLLPLALLIDLVVLYWFINSEIKISRWSGVFIYFLVVFLGFVHPFDSMTLFIVSSFFILILILKQLLASKKENFLKLYLIKFSFIGSAVFTSAVYYVFLIGFDPSFLSWGNQNVTESPSIANVLLGYGLIFLLAVFSLILINLKNNNYLFILTWIFIILFFAYIPFHYQRRVLSSLFIPLCILAAISLSFFLNHFFKLIKNKAGRFLLIFLIILFFSLSNISVIWSNLVLSSQEDAGFHLPSEYYSALNWLKEKEGLVVLATPYISNAIPGFTLNKVYVGHIIQSADYSRKYQEIKEWFFKTNTEDQEKRKWLKKQGINYIVYGDLEKSLGDFQPGQKDYLEEVYSNTKVQIYQVL